VRLCGFLLDEESATTTLSSKGRVGIPAAIRSRLGLKVGAQFVVVADRDVVIFKLLDPPALGEFETLVGRARQAAKRAGLRQVDLANAVSKVRRSSWRRSAPRFRPLPPTRSLIDAPNRKAARPEGETR
jgi:AbrB family looped-hinge helix DNA binding protein